MSYVFEADDTTVWSPGLRTGALYVRLAECQAEMQGTPTGLSRVASDYYILDTVVFGSFVQSLLGDPSFTSPVFSGLLRGFVATSLVMLKRAGSPIPPSGPSGPQLAELADLLAARMPA